MARRPLSILVASAALMAFGFAVFRAGAPDGGTHWATAPLVAFSIVLFLGGLVALASGVPDGRRGR